MQVIAKINGNPITQDELEREMTGLLRQMTGGQPPPGLSPEQKAQIQQQAFQQMVLKEQLRSYAEEKKLEVSAQKLDQEIEEMEGRMGGAEALDAALAQSGINRTLLREDLQRGRLLEVAVNFYQAQLDDASAEEVEEYYRSNVERYSTKATIAASHILFGATPGEEAPAKEVKRAKAEEVRGQLVAGADFAELAKTHSTCPSSNNGGELGTFPREKMIPAFSDVAFDLEIGEISPIVETEFGLHLIKVTERTDGKTGSLEEVREKVAEHVKEGRVEEWFRALVEKAEVEDVTPK